MTNFHVIDGAQEIRIVLATGEQRPAITLSDDSPFTDLAVLLVPPNGLRTADFGNSAELRPGDTVLAIARGRLSDAHETVTAGVVSGIGRTWARNGILLEDLVQTDASVNAGDSGGALINLDGEFVGLLTTVVRTDGSGRSVHGVSFAQSSNSLRPVFERIVEQGSYPRARLGIERPLHHHLEISPSLALDQDLPVKFGALIVNTEPGSPADSAGVRAGDIIVSVNGSTVDFNNPLPNLLKRLTVGADADLLLIRDGEEFLITISPWMN
jgi:S1-C subfamily serine protease